MFTMERYLHPLSGRQSLTLIRLSIAIVFRIGLLKFVLIIETALHHSSQHSPLMSFFYEHPEDYKQHLTHEANTNQKQEHGKRLIIPWFFQRSWRRGGDCSLVWPILSIAGYCHCNDGITTPLVTLYFNHHPGGMGTRIG
ncbi:MAG: DUF417 family protein [Escherichia coli]